METATVLVILGGLAQESRLAVFRLLVETGPGGLAAGEIATHLEIPSTTLSFHLKNMSHAGLVLSERQGTSIRYSANFGAMIGLVQYLTSNCCDGDMSACIPDTNESSSDKGSTL